MADDKQIPLVFERAKDSHWRPPRDVSDQAPASISEAPISDVESALGRAVLRVNSPDVQLVKAGSVAPVTRYFADLDGGAVSMYRRDAGQGVTVYEHEVSEVLQERGYLYRDTDHVERFDYRGGAVVLWDPASQDHMPFVHWLLPGRVVEVFFDRPTTPEFMRSVLEALE